MGFFDNVTPQSMTGVGNNHYQFVSLHNIISAFMVTHVGEDKLINKVNRTDVQFFAMRAIQELSYDVFRSVKMVEFEVPGGLATPLPHDYINYVKLSRVGSDGIERTIYPTGKTSAPFHISQDENGNYQYDNNGNLLEAGASTTATNFNTVSSTDSQATDTASSDILIDHRGRRYGLDPQHAQQNGVFFIDYEQNFIHFGSSLSGKTIVLRYVSDGLGTDDEMVVHKFCEEAVYKWIAYGILSSRTNIPEYIVQRYKKERFAETRKAKIRLSNIKIEEFTQVLKGLSKPIK